MAEMAKMTSVVNNKTIDSHAKMNLDWRRDVVNRAGVTGRYRDGPRVPVS